MTNEPLDPVWQRLSKALFGGRKTSDEGLFVYRVMEEVRRLQPALQDAAWTRFLRWAIPVLGMSAACLAMAAHFPAPAASASMDTALFQQQSQDDDSLSSVLEETP